MLSFLNAGVLFAAAAALIPLIIHLFSRRRVKIVEFSSLRHLKAMQRRQVRRLKIRQLLLLLVRMLIILAVVLAFARPTTTSTAVGSHAAVSAVIILDNSASMNRFVPDGNLFDLSRESAERLLANFSQADQVMLIGTDFDQHFSTEFGSATAASERLSQVRVGQSAIGLQPAIETALDQLERSSNLNKEIYLITDRQRIALPEKQLMAEAGLSEEEVGFYFVDILAGDDANCSVVSLDFGGQLIRPGQDFRLRATVRNFGPEEATDKIASLYLNGTRVAQTDFNVAAGSETAVSFERSVSRTGHHSGWVEISDDKFLDDNRRYFSFSIPDNFNLLLIEEDISAQYIALALSPDSESAQHYSLKRATPSQLAGVNFRDYDAIMLIGCPTLSENYISRLRAYVERGNNIFVTFGGTTDINLYNSTWSELTGVRYDEPPPTNFSRAGYYTFKSLSETHPIFDVFDFDNSGLPEIKFFALPKMHTNVATSTLIEFTGGRPALTEQTFGAGRVLCFTAPLDPSFSDLVGHSFFVPFISRVAEYLSADLAALDITITVGDVVTRTVSFSGDLNYPVELIAPDSSRYAIHPKEDSNRLTVPLGVVTQCGEYRIVYLGREQDRFCVNLDPSEGNLSEATVEDLAASVGVEELRVLPIGEELSTAIAGFRFGRELWQLFLWAAVILVALEIFLARGEQNRDADTGV